MKIARTELVVEIPCDGGGVRRLVGVDAVSTHINTLGDAVGHHKWAMGEAYVALGHALLIVRERMPHGAWGAFLDSLRVNRKTGERAMRIARDWGDGAGGLDREKYQRARSAEYRERSESLPESRNATHVSQMNHPTQGADRAGPNRAVSNRAGLSMGASREAGGGGAGVGVGVGGNPSVRELVRLSDAMKIKPPAVKAVTWDPAAEEFVVVDESAEGAGGQAGDTGFFESEERKANIANEDGREAASGPSSVRAFGPVSLRHVGPQIGPQLGLFDGLAARAVAAVERARAFVRSGACDGEQRQRIVGRVERFEREMDEEMQGQRMTGVEVGVGVGMK